MPQERKVHFNYIPESPSHINFSNLTSPDSIKNCSINLPLLPTNNVNIDMGQKLQLMNWELRARRQRAELYPFSMAYFQQEASLS